MKSQVEFDLPYIVENLNALTVEKKIYKVSEWAAEKRYLPPELSSNAGHWDNDVTPYLVEIMDCFSENSPIRDVAFMKGAQIGATTGILENAIGYIIDHAPGPTLYVNADKDMAEMGIELRIDRMISSAGISHKIFSQTTDNDRYSKKTGSTKSKKEFKGGFLLARGANSPGKLRMFSVKYLLLDEIDGFPVSAGKEGDPVTLAEARTQGYMPVRKRLYNSTPAVMHTSKIYERYKAGDERKYFVPCKDCGHYQTLNFEPNKAGKGGIVYEKDDDGNLVEGSVGYVCEECGVIWKNSDKVHFLTKGEWRATSKTTDPVLRSYHLNSLYSPVGMFSWDDAVRQWIKAQHDVQKLKAFINTVLGEPWEERGDRPEYRSIMRQRVKYLSGTVPKDVLFLTAACDVHKGRIDVEILGWAKNQVTYSIQWLSVKGDTISSDGEAWRELEKLIMNGVDGHDIKMTLVDSGYLTDQVYRFCSLFGTGVFPLKGMPRYNWKTAYKLVKVEGYGDLQCLHVSVDFYKDRLAEWLKKREGDDGYKPWGICYYPADYKDAYFKQYANEQKFEKVNPKTGELLGYEWRKRNNNADQHAWDCRVYNLAAFDLLLDLYRLHANQNMTIEQFFELLAS